MPLIIEPMPGGTGAIATGIDLREPLSSGVREALNAALVEHIALCVRGQNLTPTEYVAAARNFGEPMPQQFSEEFGHPDEPIVQIMTNHQRNAVGESYMHGLLWHTDHTHVPEPPNYTTLYAIELPRQGGATRIANMHKAYDALPEATRQRIDAIKVITTQTQGKSSLTPSRKATILAVDERVRLGSPHPLVRTHPVNGRKGVYFHPIKVEYLDGMTPDESRELLWDLLKKTTREEFVYRHRWQVGDFLIWDNRAALHQADFDYDQAESRVMYRMILKGERPFGPAMPREAAAPA